MIPTKALTQAVNQIVKRNEETKFVIDAPWKSSATLAAFTDFTCAITGTGEIYSLIPRISQGTDDHNRIGNEIQPTSLKATFTAAINGKMIASDYVDVDFYFLTSKQIKTQASVASVPILRMLNQGDGTNVGYTGALYNSHYPVNTSEFTLIKKKTCRLFKCQDQPNTQGSGGTNSYVGGGRLQHYQTFSVKIPFPKKLKYEKAASVAPENYFHSW